MGARLAFAKVIDRQMFYDKGGRVHPGLENEVLVPSEPGTAGAFLVIRGWGDDHGSFTERWKLQGPGGLTLYESQPREVHVATPTHTEQLEDEITDLEVDAASDDYNVVFYLDDREVARVYFPVVLNGERT